MPKQPTLETLMSLLHAILNLPWQTKLGLILTFTIWGFGVKKLFLYSLNRRDLNYSEYTGNPIKIIFGFDKKEWSIFVVIVICAFTFGIWGINAQF